MVCYLIKINFEKKLKFKLELYYGLICISLIPIFVQVQSSQRNMYIGLCEGSALKTHFQIIHFNYIPSQYANLSGLLDIFKSKLVKRKKKKKLLINK